MLHVPVNLILHPDLYSINKGYSVATFSNKNTVYTRDTFKRSTVFFRPFCESILILIRLNLAMNPCDVISMSKWVHFRL